MQKTKAAWSTRTSMRLLASAAASSKQPVTYAAAKQYAASGAEEVEAATRKRVAVVQYLVHIDARVLFSQCCPNTSSELLPRRVHL